MFSVTHHSGQTQRLGVFCVYIPMYVVYFYIFICYEKKKPIVFNTVMKYILVVNLGSLLLISGSYLWMFFVAKTTHRATETLIRHRSLSESAMAWRMSLLVATDAACWVPIIGLGLWSLAGFTVHPKVKQ